MIRRSFIGRAIATGLAMLTTRRVSAFPTEIKADPATLDASIARAAALPTEAEAKARVARKYLDRFSRIAEQSGGKVEVVIDSWAGSVPGGSHTVTFRVTHGPEYSEAADHPDIAGPVGRSYFRQNHGAKASS